MLEVGLAKKWKQIYWPKEDECSSTAEGGNDVNRTVNVGDMQGSFYVLLLGPFFMLTNSAKDSLNKIVFNYLGCRVHPGSSSHLLRMLLLEARHAVEGKAERHNQEFHGREKGRHLSFRFLSSPHL